MRISNYLKTNAVHLIIILLLIIYIAFSNNIFSYIKVVDESSVIKNLDVKILADNPSILYYIDIVRTNKLEWKDVITIEGWTFIDNSNASNNRIYVFLTSKKNTYIFDTIQYPHLGVEEKYKDEKIDLKNVSFLANIPYENIKDDVYNIGLLIITGKNNSANIKSTEKYIGKKNGKIIDDFKVSDFISKQQN